MTLNKNIELLLKRLENKADEDLQSFITIIALDIRKNQFIFEGEVKGEIIKSKKGIKVSVMILYSSQMGSI